MEFDDSNEPPFNFLPFKPTFTRQQKCFFSELTDLSKEADYYQLHKLTKYGNYKNSYKKLTHNSTYQIQNHKDLIIMSKGGMLFNLPLDQKIERIFPISNGLIIEFFIKQEPKFSGKPPNKKTFKYINSL